MKSTTETNHVQLNLSGPQNGSSTGGKNQLGPTHGKGASTSNDNCGSGRDKTRDHSQKTTTLATNKNSNNGDGIRNVGVGGANKENHDNSSVTDGTGSAEIRSSKKRRLENAVGGGKGTESISSQSTAIISHSNKWQDIYRQGARFKTLLDGVLVQVASAATETKFMGGQEDGRGHSSASHAGMNNNADGNNLTSIADRSSLSQLAQSKQIELHLLKQELEQARADKAALAAINDSLRESKSKQDDHVQKLTEALQRASAKATSARVDADEARTEAETFSAKLEALEVVVQETKQASQLLMGEQNELIQRSQCVEQRFVKAQADLARSEASKLKMEQNYDIMASKLKEAQDRLAKSNVELDNERSAREKAQQEINELQSIKNAHEGQLKRLEEELRRSQELFLDVSAATAETSDAKDQLQNALEKLQQANIDLHEQLQHEKQKQREQHEKYHESLTKMKGEHQATLEQIESYRNEAAAIKLEKIAAEKKAEGLQSRIVNLERRLNDSTALTGSSMVVKTMMSSIGGGGVGDPLTAVTAGTTGNMNGQDGQSVESMAIPSLQRGIPALAAAKKDSSGNLIPKCAFCFKDVTGPSRKCQCGKKDCSARAHAQCAQRFIAAGTSTSVSHPGTPAPRLPIILCRPVHPNNFVDINTKITTTNETSAIIPAITPANKNDRASF
jgi:hypothetical protein